MPERPARKASRRRHARETLTSQRLTVLGWAFAATLCGLAGLSAVQFTAPGAPSPFRLPPGTPYAGLRLPDASPVTSTASIGLNGQDVSIGVYGRPGTGSSLDPSASAHLETLQKEIVSLRRRLAVMSEQNGAYSRRLAALEDVVKGADDATRADAASGPASTARLATPSAREISAPAGASVPRPTAADAARTSAPRAAANPASVRQIQPQAGVVPAPESGLPGDDDRDSVRSRIESIPAPETREGPFLKLSELPRGANKGEGSGAPAPAPRPVRLVQLPSADLPPAPQTQVAFVPQALPEADADDPVSTASIPQDAADIEQDAREAMRVQVSRPAGRSLSSAPGPISRTDFAVVVAHLDKPEDATIAWQSFLSENGERLGALELSARTTASMLSPGKTDLLVGPFANAADATVACLKLKTAGDHCYPTLFAGDALPLAPREGTALQAAN